MYAIAKIYSNKMNEKLNIKELPELDEKPTLPRDCKNAGNWFGFVMGFKVCYRMMQELRMNDAASTKAISEVLHTETKVQV